MGGLEPPTVYLPLELHILLTRLLYQLSYTTHHLKLYIAYYHRPSHARQPHPASALFRHYPSPAIWAHALLVLALRSLDLRSFNTPLLRWLIRPTSLMSHSSLGLTLLPIPVPVAPRPTRERMDSEITFSRWQYFTTLFHAVSFHTIWLFASSLFRCRFVAVTPVMVTQAIPSTMLHYFCLLTGIALCTSLGVCGR